MILSGEDGVEGMEGQDRKKQTFAPVFHLQKSTVFHCMHVACSEKVHQSSEGVQDSQTNMDVTTRVPECL